MMYNLGSLSYTDVRAAKIWVDGGSTSVTVVGVDGAGTYEGYVVSLCNHAYELCNVFSKL